MDLSIIEKLRVDTPGISNGIHLNNAGAALQPLPVIENVREYLAQEALIGGYELMNDRANELNGFYESIARLIHAEPRNIAYASNATDAFTKALSSVPLHAGDVLLTTKNDYVSNQIAFLYLQKHHKIEIVRAENTGSGEVDPDSVEKLIQQKRPKLVVVTQVPTSSGMVQDVAAIGRLCQMENIWYLVDACQAVGQLLVDVEEIGCDFLSATSRKFLRGPRGAGFLYVSDRALNEGLEPVFPDLQGAFWTSPDTYRLSADARRFEIWERNYALLLGTKYAADYACQVGLEWIEQRVKSLATLLRNMLSELPGVKVLDRGKERCGIVTAHIAGQEGMSMRDALRVHGVNISVTTPAVAQIDFAEKKVPWALRFSPHYYNTESELEEVISIIKMIVK